MVNIKLKDTPAKHPVLFTKAPSNSKVYRERLSAHRVRDALLVHHEHGDPGCLVSSLRDTRRAS